MLNMLFMNMLAILPSSKRLNFWYLRLWFLSMGCFFSIFMLYSPMLSHTQMSQNMWIDGLSMPLITLTWWISILMLIASQTSVLNTNNKVNYFSFLISLLNLILLIVFMSSNLIWFYFSFEASLIPTLILILGWGYQPERLQAGIYMVLYTVTASLPLLILILFWSSSWGSNSLILMANTSFNYTPWLKEILIVVTLAAFLVKLPMFTVHLWLPKAHVEAPVAGSMILAGILLKLGGYGLLRMFQLVQINTSFVNSFLFSLGLWGGVITSFICFRQTDLKSLIAYSSVGHMSIMLAGVFSASSFGFQAGLSMMVAHGLCSSALFSLANYSYEKVHSRSLYICKGMLMIIPSISMWWFIFCVINMAAPPSINLLSEILLFPVVFFKSPWVLTTMMIMTFLGAVYNLFLYTSTQHGGSPSFLYSYNSIKPSQNLLLIAHAIPVNILILKPELVCNWLI
uniref:NADH dehydrogenase subunit 4 n=1 Tax=Nerita plicata TaxID=483686 RepID=UPI002237D5F5|nr:NADH dehydrogenase subunit 4 [Nerita plicata]UYI29914.1 NADH dehydrogenase subunit 4 [Nerita plicata]